MSARWELHVCPCVLQTVGLGVQGARKERRRVASRNELRDGDSGKSEVLGFAKEAGRRASDAFLEGASGAPEFLENRDHTHSPGDSM